MNVDLEHRISEIGREIFARVRGQSRANPFLRGDEWLMNFVLRDEAVKSQLFRFVDTLPALRNSQQISGHLREYLLAAGGRLPRVLQTAARHWPSNGWSAPIAAVVEWGVRRMARKFVAADDSAEAALAIAQLRRRRLAFTVDLLGEAVVSEAEARAYQGQYLSILRTLPEHLAALPGDALLDEENLGKIPRTHISIKLSSLYSQFDPIDPIGTRDAVLERLRPILRSAQKAGAFVNLDMEQFAYKTVTLDIFKTVLTEEEFRDWRDVGIAIQAYLTGTLEDLQNLADWSRQRGTPVWIRLVKGAYWDFETVVAAQNEWENPVFTQKAMTDVNFENCSEFLMQNAALLRPAIASHNIRSLAAAIALAEKYGIDSRAMEFQMLYGMADAEKSALVEMQRRVRVYMPVGRLLPGMAYLIRRLLENTSNESFLRAGFLDHQPEERLLMNPATLVRSVRSSGNHVARSDFSFRNEPPADFSIERHRRLMAEGIAKIESQKLQRYPLIIGGESIETDRWIDSVNPSHKSRIVGRCACATPANAEAAARAAKRAFAGWRETPAENRAKLLERVGEILRRDRFELAAVEVLECGKPWREADADVVEAIDYCFYYAMEMRRLSQKHGRDLPGEQNDWTYESRGPAVVIAPWNFPLAILCGMSAAAIVAGNPVILKPAEQSSVIAARLSAAYAEAGAPAGVVNYLPGVGEEIGPILVGHPDIAIIAFTGSRAVGLKINQQAAATPGNQDHVKRVIVEMGGKNAVIVDEDADLDEAVAGVVASAFFYAGQKCSACSRVIVLAGVYDAFLSRLIEATRSLKIAPAEDPACRVGPVIDAEAFERIGAAIARGKREARLVYAGDARRLGEEGYFIPPHIFAEVNRKSFLAQEEIFAPVLSVMKAGDFDEALDIALDVKYALTGGLYSRSPEHIERARREFRVGNLYINRKITGAIVGRQPFGGFKLSGGGTQAGGRDYLLNFLWGRCVTENTLRHGFVPGSE
jgi:RHH-type transcriptional regulator, proline utilization regulon repressor / proline dehydrogenase / delta 1-pyrroline-5-carboxylate dehydrogenase